MNKHFVLLPILTLLLFLGLSEPSWANSGTAVAPATAPKKADLVFSLLGYKVLSSPREPSGYMAITLAIHNTSQVHKIDIRGGFAFRLKDEFGNVYRRLPKPKDYSLAPGKPNAHYPSLYPGETAMEVLFFEPPVKPTLNFVLNVVPLPEGPMADSGPTAQEETAGPVSLAFHVAPPIVPPKPPKPFLPKEGDLRLVYPGRVVQTVPGGSVYVKLSLAKNLRRPDKAFVVAPDTIFNDKGRKLQYHLRIGRHQSAGTLTYVFIAQWDNGPHPVVLSQSLQVKVCPHNNCPKNISWN